MMAPLITVLAFLADWIVGDPERWPHPVRLVGRLISGGEKLTRRVAGSDPARLRRAGPVLALAVVIITMTAAGLILWIAAVIWSGLWFLAALYLVYSALCLRDLYRQTWRVEEALAGGSIQEARRLLSLVVGRDTDQLDEAGIRRAVVETLAENFSDGLVAPMLYLALGGPVLAWGYKAVNTLDSMIGYKNERYLDLGRFAALMDDAANYVPARLAAILLIASARVRGYDWRGAADIWRRDGHLHSSPNSGQPEAAMAGALGVWLGGPGSYGGVVSEKPVINAGASESGAEAVKGAEKIVVGGAVMMLILVVLFLIPAGIWGWM